MERLLRQSLKFIFTLLACRMRPATALTPFRKFAIIEAEIAGAEDEDRTARRMAACRSSNGLPGFQQRRRTNAGSGWSGWPNWVMNSGDQKGTTFAMESTSCGPALRACIIGSCTSSMVALRSSFLAASSRNAWFLRERSILRCGGRPDSSLSL